MSQGMVTDLQSPAAPVASGRPRHIWALVPIKRFDQAKSRLAPTLSPAGRRLLAMAQARRTLSLLTAMARLDGVAILSSDVAALVMARRLGAATIRDGGAGLNAELGLGARLLAAHGADAVLVLPTDLPLLDVRTVEALLDHGGRDRAVIVPARRDGGTNALLLPASATFAFQFGPDSARRHADIARAEGYSAAMLDLDRLAVDCDTPEDYAAFGAPAARDAARS